VPPVDAGARLDALLARPSCAVLTDDDTPVVVAYSGGADSAALLALACRAGRCVHAVHVDHGLRPESSREAALAVAAAMMAGASTARAVRVEVGAGNLEERARDARHEALEHARVQLGAALTLLGHTLDDQAETVLLAVLRGSGLAGLSGMPARRDAIARPLLDVRRSETRAVCSELGVDVVDDPTNHDRRLDRVWLRRELLPALSKRSGRDLAPVLARQAARVAEESDHLDRAAAAALHRAGDPPSARALAELDRVILRRALRRLVGPPWIGGDAVDAAVDVVMGLRRAAELPRGRTLARHDGVLTVERTVTPSDTVPPTFGGT
jgi:tRNA(Ile)-lysidine synthase